MSMKAAEPFDEAILRSSESKIRFLKKFFTLSSFDPISSDFTEIAFDSSKPSKSAEFFDLISSKPKISTDFYDGSKYKYFSSS